ncbi:MAG: 4-hydroxy-3-methylbut-2-enyl diphosphate reductase [Candidatus Riflebacteria bacterium]|nr:4-hydroxy-3-methylbut-2-enyl diphosphate reductase [Candidatus Riflebacteria bacterium]
MKKIIKAQTSGFCMGVKTAIQKAVETGKSSKEPTHTYGPLIHNPQALQRLEKFNVHVAKDWRVLNSGNLIIRAHGIPSDEMEEIKKSNLKVVDATCPHVKVSQKKITEYADKGYLIIITGDPNHPEMLSLKSFAPKHILISSLKDAKKLERQDKVMLISQTTFSKTEYENIAEHIKTISQEAVVADSICLATSQRQEEIRNLAKQADATVIVGGKESANTTRLAEIARTHCPNVFHIETAQELNPELMKSFETIAVSAGASTPDFITDEVIALLESLVKNSN